jgi:hypothetical protein
MVAGDRKWDWVDCEGQKEKEEPGHRPAEPGAPQRETPGTRDQLSRNSSADLPPAREHCPSPQRRAASQRGWAEPAAVVGGGGPDAGEGEPGGAD